MEKVTTKRLALYSGRTHPALAQEVATHLNIELGHDNIVEFSNGEVRCRFGESSAAPTCSSCRATTASTAARSTTRSWST